MRRKRSQAELSQEEEQEENREVEEEKKEEDVSVESEPEADDKRSFEEAEDQANKKLDASKPSQTQVSHAIPTQDNQVYEDERQTSDKLEPITSTMPLATTNRLFFIPLNQHR